MELGICPECGCNILPFSDTDKEHAPITYKAWVCINCGKGLVMRGGDIYPYQLIKGDD